MSKQHTPGPWKADAATDKRSGIHVRGGTPYQDAHFPPSVAKVVQRYGRASEAEANARLIAAAPDLLAAAEAMLIDVTDPREGVHRAPRTVYVEALRAAIAKAKGAHETVGG